MTRVGRRGRLRRDLPYRRLDEEAGGVRVNGSDAISSIGRHARCRARARASRPWERGRPARKWAEGPPVCSSGQDARDPGECAERRDSWERGRPARKWAEGPPVCSSGQDARDPRNPVCASARDSLSGEKPRCRVTRSNSDPRTGGRQSVTVPASLPASPAGPGLRTARPARCRRAFRRPRARWPVRSGPRTGEPSPALAPQRGATGRRIRSPSRSKAARRG